ncbi:MAG: hypothetical protein ACP5U2_02785 [Bryobacteraceae bacterium]
MKKLLVALIAGGLSLPLVAQAPSGTQEQTKQETKKKSSKKKKKTEEEKKEEKKTP